MNTTKSFRTLRRTHALLSFRVRKVFAGFFWVLLATLAAPAAVNSCIEGGPFGSAPICNGSGVLQAPFPSLDTNMVSACIGFPISKPGLQSLPVYTDGQGLVHVTYTCPQSPPNHDVTFQIPYFGE